MFCTFDGERCMEFLLMASVFSMKSMYSFDIYLLNACYKPETLQSTLSREQESDYSQDTSPSSGKTLNKFKKKIYLKIFIYTFKKKEPEQKSAYYLS